MHCVFGMGGQGEVETHYLGQLNSMPAPEHVVRNPLACNKCGAIGALRASNYWRLAPVWATACWRSVL